MSTNRRSVAKLVRTVGILVKIIKAKNAEIAGLRNIISTMEMEANRLHARLETDAMTGLYNRGGLYQAWYRTAPSITAVALIDGDGFKQINDQYGHAVGDEVIITIADTLTEAGITAARFGGDEFVGLITDTDPEAAAERFRVLLNRPRTINGHTITLSATIGLCVIMKRDNNGWPVDDLDGHLDQADTALYAGKRAGRNTIICITN